MTELQALAGVTAILFILIITQGLLTPVKYGFSWGLSARDKPVEPDVLMGRLSRTVANHLEGMGLFVPLVLMVVLAELSSPLTVWGATIFLAARAAFAIVYVAGIPVLRTLMFNVGMIGLMMMGYAVVIGLF